MSAGASREVVPRLVAEGGEEGSIQAQSIFSVDTPEELVQFRTSEVERLREDVNTPVTQLVTALLQLGVSLADYPDLGDPEPPFREAKEFIDNDAGLPYSLERQVLVRTWGRVLQRKKEFDAADTLFTAALDETKHSRGREHPWTLELQNNLGCLRTAAGVWYATQGRMEVAKECFDGADVLFKKSYKAKLQVFNPIHRATLKTKCNISIVSFLRGEASKLEAELVGTLHELTQSYGTQDSSAKEVASHLVSIYQRMGNHDRAVDISERFGVDAPEDYEIRPFEDSFIPGLVPRRRFTEISSDYTEDGELPIELLRNVLDVVDPSWGRYSVQVLSWTREKIKKWTGMDVYTFCEAVGLPADWGIITRREVLLEQAAAAGHIEAVELLLHKMSEASSTADEAALVKAFHRAVESGNEDVIRLFLNHGVDLFATDDTGQLALHKAAELGLEDAFTELLAWVDDIDLRNSDGDTALEVALRENREHIIREVMIEKGALIASSKSTMNTSAKKKPDEFQVEVLDEMFYTGFDATIVDFYVDRKHEVEEHSVQTKPVEAVVSDPDLLRSIVCGETSDEKADFTWIHIPANNMFWIETLMKNLTEVSENEERYSDLMTKEMWQNQLHESLHGAFHGRFMKPFCGKVGDSPCSHTVLYMPYIHWESNSMKKEMDDAIKNVEKGHRDKWKNVAKLFTKYISSRKRNESRDSTRRSYSNDSVSVEETRPEPDLRLLETYLHLSGAPPLHVRRTFDQFQYYMNDDTAARDADQVVSRYFERRHPGATVPIMMVDQLWMWIIDNRILVTSFPQRWGEGGIVKEKRAIFNMRNVLHSILDRLKMKVRDPIWTVYDLADMIIVRCLGLHSDSTQWENERHRYLEIFEHSINYVTDEEIRLFNYFADGGRVGEKAKKRSSKEAEEEKDTLNGLRQLKIFLSEVLEKGFDPDESQAIVDSAANAKRRWDVEEKDIEEIFDISNEIELLKEIKDIQDELNILRTLYEQQGRVVSSYHHVSDERTRPSGMVGAIRRLTGIVEKMDSDAQRPYKALEDLLDLKQKQANVSEARIARVSGNTITVFTIVTIIFLPASFMAAFFALPIAEYPFVDELFHLDYAIKWTMSVTAAIAVPLIILALYVNPIMRVLRLMGRIIRIVAKIVTKLAERSFKGAAVLRPLPRLFFKCICILGLLFGASILFVFSRFKRVIQWGKEYRAAKKETRRTGEVWSKRRYILGGLLQKRLEKRAAQDEEEQRWPSSRGRSITPRSVSSEANRSRSSREQISSGGGEITRTQ